MNTKNPQVDKYLARIDQWREESAKLREIILEHPLTEELKWGKPCYTSGESNILIIQGFKNYCALMFCKGSLLKDPHGVLIQQTPSVQAARQVRFTSLRDLTALTPILHAYIDEAITAETAGLKVEFKRNPEPIPEELQSKLDELPALKAAFAALSPGRQRGYILYFSAAKQTKTREARIEKCIPQILAGKGLDD